MLTQHRQDLAFFTSEAMIVPFDFFPEEGTDPADLPTLVGANYDLIIKTTDFATTLATLSSDGMSPRITVLGTPRTDPKLGEALSSIDVNILTSETGGLTGAPGEFVYCVRVRFAGGRVEIGVPPSGYIVRPC